MNEKLKIGPGGRYEIHDHLGSGGLARVYRAYDHHLGRWVAIKQLQTSVGTESVLRKEAMALAALHHPNVVTVHDLQSEGDDAFVVMELVEGETFEARLARGRMGLEEFLLCSRQILDGVHAAHLQGVMHRDLKPSNLMITMLPGGRQQIKVLDFGLARHSLVPRAQTMDQNGAMYGSIYCMAPEQFLRRFVDVRTDIYALGVSFYHALAGAYPFQGDNAGAIIASHLTHAATPLGDLRPDLPPLLCQWVMWMLNCEPDDRPRDVEDCLQSLNALDLTPIPATATARVTTVPPEESWFTRFMQRTPPPWANRRTLALAASLVVSTMLLNVEAGASGGRTVHRTGMAAVPQMSRPIILPQDDIDVTDLATLRRCLGQTVTVSGTPQLLSDSRTGAVRYLNFDKDYWRALSLVFFVNEGPTDFTHDALQQFVGKPVRVTGTVTEHNGNLQIVVHDKAVLEFAR